ncbi:hypothetical protein HPB48_010375 [Haemaphysalis longicornis]|uniref:Uncharacterized protein n=1 Tax=Haemaphysalis longicornis TaxID=44386 RepID=A0A9J6GNH1_HAELO|nr:hypothetical protein HPB48_010375 [Haemaphysalis longicornis]
MNLLDALIFIAMAWLHVSPTTIGNCFSKCSTIKSCVVTSSQEPDSVQIDIWDQLGVECTADKLVTANDDLATRGQQSVADIVNDVGTSQVEVASSADEDNCNSCNDQPPIAAETTYALDILQHVVASETAPKNTSAQFFSSQNSLLAELVEMKMQLDIQHLFA